MHESPTPEGDCMYCGQPMSEPPGPVHGDIARGAAVPGPHHREHDEVDVVPPPDERWLPEIEEGED